MQAHLSPRSSRGQSQMTLALVPHRRLPTIIIDHPLEGDKHICLEMDGPSVDTVVPRHVSKVLTQVS